jgi:antitoxin VapB
MNIKSPEAHRLATELAQLRGISTTQAVLDAVRNDLEREKQLHRKKGLAAELMAIAGRCSAELRPMKSEDHATMLYDEKGLPK